MVAADLSLRATLGGNASQRWLDISVLFSIVFACYLLLNWQFIGPTYLGDEIGYLSNAAFLTGHQIDASSSYHFGYSLFLIPSFLLFSDTSTIWKSILVTNALIFSTAFSVLYLIAERLCANRLKRVVFVLLTAAYPAYPIMSGYSFSQPAFVLVFLLCCLTLLRSSEVSYRGQLLFGFLVGFLYWVHPTALAVAVATAVIGLGTIISDRKALLPILASMIATLGMIVLYKLALHPWMMESMTPQGFAAKSHYPSISESIFAVLSVGSLVEILTRFLGQFSYLIVSTLSIITVVFLIFPAIFAGKYRSIVRSKNINSSIYVFVFLSLLFVMTVSSVFFSSRSEALDSWFYGRYVEGVLAPALFISLLNTTKKGENIAVTLIVIASFLLLYWYSGHSETWLNMINEAGLWPAVLYPENRVYWWFSIGAIGCVVGILAPRPVRLVFLIAFFALCIAGQVKWHHGSFSITSTPSGLPAFVRGNLEPGSCIGIGSRPKDRSFLLARERFNLYSFYFHNYRYQRMTPSGWFESCDGYYLSYQDEKELLALGAKQVGMEAKTGLYVYAKEPLARKGNRSDDPLFLVQQPGSGSERFTLNMSAAQLSPFVEVGVYDDGALRTSGKSGFLFFGPYIVVEPGVLKFKVYGSANKVAGAWIDVTSAAGGTVLREFPIQSTEGVEGILVEGEFDVPERVRDMEIRLRVHEESDIRFIGYDLAYPH